MIDNDDPMPYIKLVDTENVKKLKKMFKNQKNIDRF